MGVLLLKNCALSFAVVVLAYSSIAIADVRCDDCTRDKHGHIQRSAAAKAVFKKLHPCPSTERRKGACPGYVIDHIIALKRGGKDSPDNMQWQTIEDAKAKDKWE